MFSNIDINTNMQFKGLTFLDQRAISFSLIESRQLSSLASLFHDNFLKRIEEISIVLNNMSGSQEVMYLLEQQKREGFIQGVLEFQKTYQELVMIKTMHGRTIMAKHLKIQKIIDDLIKALGECKSEVWQNLCTNLIITDFRLLEILNNLSFLNN